MPAKMLGLGLENRTYTCCWEFDEKLISHSTIHLMVGGVENKESNGNAVSHSNSHHTSKISGHTLI